MAKGLFSTLNLSYHSTEWVFRNFSFLLFLSFLALLYIANAHFAEKNVREIQALQKKIKELKWEYTSIKSETMYKSIQSQMDANLEQSGLDLAKQGPKVIEIK
ncbi:MAG: hypothetical protein IT260_09880 [Saprospiraceae bacterium]|nr:hypothetical protein [Saprospiraceae bacterium]